MSALHDVREWRLPGEDRTYLAELCVDMIPQASWFKNVRAVIQPTEWSLLRFSVYERAGFTCELCGARDVRLDCHERFSYSINRDRVSGTQRLVRLLAVCTPCHSATHFGLASVMGREDAAVAHLMRVRGWTEDEVDAHIVAAFDTWEAHNQIRWSVDLSMISNAGFGLVVGR